MVLPSRHPSPHPRVLPCFSLSPVPPRLCMWSYPVPPPVTAELCSRGTVACLPSTASTSCSSSLPPAHSVPCKCFSLLCRPVLMMIAATLPSSEGMYVLCLPVSFSHPVFLPFAPGIIVSRIVVPCLSFPPANPHLSFPNLPLPVCRSLRGFYCRSLSRLLCLHYSVVPASLLSVRYSLGLIWNVVCKLLSLHHSHMTSFSPLLMQSAMKPVSLSLTK